MGKTIKTMEPKTHTAGISLEPKKVDFFEKKLLKYGFSFETDFNTSLKDEKTNINVSGTSEQLAALDFLCDRWDNDFNQFPNFPTDKPIILNKKLLFNIKNRHIDYFLLGICICFLYQSLLSLAESIILKIAILLN